MTRPYWMESGKLIRGIPSKLGYGKFGTTRTDRLRYQKKMAERKQRQEEHNNLVKKAGKRILSEGQKKAGAHFVA